MLTNILSPNNLAKEYKRKGMVHAQITKLQEEVKSIQHMHNGKHPSIPKEKDYREKED